jgi:hypothetical protein
MRSDLRNRLIWFGLVVVLVVIVGCAGLDHWAGVDSQGNDLPGPSPAEQGGEAVAPFIDGIFGPPWGQIVLSALLVLQNGYIVFRRVQNRIKNGKTTT